MRQFVTVVVSLLALPPAHALEPVAFQSIQGWAEEDHAAALATFRRSCSEILVKGAGFSRPVIYGGKRGDWLEVCGKAGETIHPREFFESQFLPFRVIDNQRPDGLFTGYFEPEAQGSLVQSDVFNVPIYSRPPDLVNFTEIQQAQSGYAYGRVVHGRARPYLSRKEIESGALAGKGLEIVWLKDWADAFFIHIQGSGRVRLPDGSVLRLAYSAKSGLPYTGIGSLLVDRGAFSREEMSMQATRAWMAKNPSAARQLMWENHSFIFFQKVELADPALGALGAQHVQLTPARSVAVDRNIWMFGTPVWLETKAPQGPSAELKDFRKLLIAQDTGTAIRGHARGDVYWGSGEKAAQTAGHMKSPGRMTVLLPKAVARTIELIP